CAAPVAFVAGWALITSSAFTVAAQKQDFQQADIHRWGVVTLFHGLPSDQVRAIAQDPDGSILFGTDAGLARYDGKRVQKLAADGLLADRINALFVDERRTLWVASESAPRRFQKEKAEPIAETAGKPIDSISRSKGGIVLTSRLGVIFVCHIVEESPLKVELIGPEGHDLLNVESTGNQQTPLQLTGAIDGDADALLVATLGRGLIRARIDGSGGDTSEVLSRPRPFFVEALMRDRSGRVWMGAQTAPSGSGLYDATDLLHPSIVEAAPGTVMTLCAGADDCIWAGTSERGVFCLRNGRVVSHQTFSNTAGGLRSDRIHAVFVDREGVVWFGT